MIYYLLTNKIITINYYAEISNFSKHYKNKIIDFEIPS